MTDGAAGHSALTCSDWRGWSAHRIAPLLDLEQARWQRLFFWDQRWALTSVEAARDTGRLPGAVVSDANGVVHGWTYYLRHGNQLQIGTVVSDSPDATGALVQYVFASPLIEDASLVVFTPDAPGLAEALAIGQVRTEPYHYLACDETASPPAHLPPAPAACRGLRPADTVAVAVLMADAYRHTTFIRPFVPGGEPDAWRHYVSQLIDTRGCGEFLQQASWVIEDPSTPGLLLGAVIATRLDAHTGHIAQIVVSSYAHGRGFGRLLLDRARHALRAAGVKRTTLLVADGNTTARALYQRNGFLPAGTFLTGLRDPR